MVLSAEDSACPRSGDAVELLCRTYWYPLYAYARRAGHSPPDAADLPQGFFARLLEMAVHRLRGRYREILRHEIAQTVSTPEEIEEEIRHLYSAFGS